MRYIFGFLATLVTFVCFAPVAMANATELGLGSFSVDQTAVTTVFGSIASALAVIWAVRKVIGLINKS